MFKWEKYVQVCFVNHALVFFNEFNLISIAVSFVRKNLSKLRCLVQIIVVIVTARYKNDWILELFKKISMHCANLGMILCPVKSP